MAGVDSWVWVIGSLTLTVMCSLRERHALPDTTLMTIHDALQALLT